MPYPTPGLTCAPIGACRALALLAGLALPVPAQSLLYEVHGAGADERFGMSVAIVGDLDGDGLADLAATRFAHAGRPAVSVHAGATGALLLDFVPEGVVREPFYEPVVSGLGDIDGDGVDDLVFGVPGADLGGPDSGSVFVVSGATAEVLLRVDGWADGKRLGASVLGMGDLNGDAVPDFLAGTARTGMAAAWNGATGETLYIYGSGPATGYGTALDRIGDVNGDGVVDFVIGAPGGGPVLGFATIGSGAFSTSLLGWLTPPVGTPGFGASVAGVGDVDGDGAGDVLIGSPTEGHAWLFSSKGGGLLGRLGPDELDQDLGRSVTRAGDVDGDGVPDLIVGAPGLDPLLPGRVHLHSGKTLARLHTFQGRLPGDRFGAALAGGTDLDGDGLGDLLVGAPRAATAGTDAGSVSVWSLTP